MSFSSGQASASAVIHSVHFHSHDEALIQRLRSIVCSAIENGNAALIVATPEHQAQLSSGLEESGLNVGGLEKDGRLLVRSARELLTEFVVNGLPDRKRFVRSVGKLLSAGKKSAWNAHRGVTVFGEMVALLWADRNFTAALQLEQMWSDLLNDQLFHLHCAYPRHLFDGNGEASRLRTICEGHSHVVGMAA